MHCTLFGISNCDTIRKARRWLTAHDVAYTFHDFRKDGLSVDQLTGWVDQLGWEALLNRRGTTWRGLDESRQRELNRESAIALMYEYPAMIKRPLLQYEHGIEVGFSEARYQELFA